MISHFHWDLFPYSVVSILHQSVTNIPSWWDHCATFSAVRGRYPLIHSVFNSFKNTNTSLRDSLQLPQFEDRRPPWSFHCLVCLRLIYSVKYAYFCVQQQLEIDNLHEQMELGSLQNKNLVPFEKMRWPFIPLIQGNRECSFLYAC